MLIEKSLQLFSPATVDSARYTKDARAPREDLLKWDRKAVFSYPGQGGTGGPDERKGGIRSNTTIDVSGHAGAPLSKSNGFEHLDLRVPPVGRLPDKVRRRHGAGARRRYLDDPSRCANL
jgi:hypothetical protein